MNKKELLIRVEEIKNKCTGNCKKCKLRTKSTPIGRDGDGKITQTCKVTCLCLCDATEEEVRTKTCKYKEVVK